jgi:hypothetical protein
MLAIAGVAQCLKMVEGDVRVKKTKIVLIDSGIYPAVKFANNVSESYKLTSNDGVFSITKASLNDFIGHGTAVADIIFSCNEAIEFICFRACDYEIEIDDNGLIAILRYINENIEADIINISLGCTYVYNYNELERICHCLKNKGFIIVAAFDNDGAISYPSALDSVIGVDVARGQTKKEMLVYRKSIVDAVLPDVFYRTQWLDMKTIIRGTSFACAKFVGLLSRRTEEARLLKEKIDIISLLAADYEIKVETSFCETKISPPPFPIDRAIIFPVNKESHSLLRYKQMLEFRIAGVYDERLSGNVGQIFFDEEVKSIDDLIWNDEFDTIILSCAFELSSLTKRNYHNLIIKNAMLYNKNVYTFEDVASEYKNLYHPKIISTMVPYGNRWKMHKVSVPVVCVMGTSPKQGKFTLQLDIVNRLSNLGYNVGFISSEPSGYLLGADAVFHFGHQSQLSLHPQETAALLNEMSWNAQVKGRDIIISGSQSGTLHYNNSTIECFSVDQYGYLLGMMADYYILCINPHDEIEYIERSINFINAIDDGKVMALVVYPIKITETLSGVKYKSDVLTDVDLHQLKKSCSDITEVPIYLLGNELEMQSLTEQIIDWFSE